MRNRLNKQIGIELILDAISDSGLESKNKHFNYSYLKAFYLEEVKPYLEKKLIFENPYENITLSPELLSMYNHQDFKLSSKVWKAFRFNEEIKYYINITEHMNDLLGAFKNINKTTEYYEETLLKDKISKLSDDELTYLFYVNRKILFMGVLWINEPYLMIHRELIQNLFVKSRILIDKTNITLTKPDILLIGNGMNIALSSNIKYCCKSIIFYSKKYNLLINLITEEKHDKYLTYLNEVTNWFNEQLKIIGFDVLNKYIEGKLYEIDRGRIENKVLFDSERHKWYRLLFQNSNIRRKISTKELIEDSDFGIEDFHLLNEIKKEEDHQIESLLGEIFGATIYIMSRKTSFKKNEAKNSFNLSKIFTTNYDHNFDLIINKKIIHLHGSIYKMRKGSHVVDIDEQDVCKYISEGYKMEIILAFDGGEKIKRFGYNIGNEINEFKTQCNKCKRIHIFGFSGSNDSHLTSIINESSSIKEINYYHHNLKDIESIKDIKENITVLSDLYLSKYEISDEQLKKDKPSNYARRINIICSQSFIEKHLK